MANSTLSLPVDALSALPAAIRTSFSKSRSSGIDRAASPSIPGQRRSHDQEAVEMDVFGVQEVESVTVEIPAWNLSPRQEWIAIAACCGCLFLGGWNDATTGPLLPTIQANYGLGFTLVSMLFVTSCVGFISAGVLNVFLTDRFGFGKVVLLGGLTQVAAYSILAPAPPFPVMCAAYAMNGFGIALQNAQANGFISSLPSNTSAKLGLLHAAYGAGAFTAPLVATQFAQLPRWSFHYLVSLTLSLANVITLIVVFRLRPQDEILGIPAGRADPTTSINEQNKYKQIFSSRAVQLVAFFCWVYVGVEVTIGGWIVTFVIEERGGGSSAGYISSGFFGGIMVGRVGLLWINEKIGERRVIYIYTLLAIGLELVIWLVPNIIGNAVAVSLVGVLLGYVDMTKGRLAPLLTLNPRPFYPIAMNVTAKMVPKWILTGSIGWIASFGIAGSAVFPFITGVLAQKRGVKVLQPILVGMLACLVVVWYLVPSGPKRRGD